MKISLEWLSDFLPGPSDPHVLGDALTMGGLPVEVFEKHGADDVIDVEVTSNRSDCLSVTGVAREVAALLNRPFVPLTIASPPPAGDVPKVRVSIEAADWCPHYTARVIRGVSIRPSPPWLARRLAAVGVRPINNIVDVTNYVLFELGQPLHAFDFAKVQDQQIIVRRARSGETLVSLDGHERKLKPDVLVIADTAKPLALAGVMGGAESEITDGTTDVLLESARFDPLCVRRTARALTMKSDSSYRFERGLDPTLAKRASNRALELILQTAGGTVDGPLVEAGSDARPPEPLALRQAALKRVLGVELSTDAVVDGLDRLGFAPRLVGDAINCFVPSHRLDVSIEIDLMEEAARVVGYDKIPVRGEVSIRLQPTDSRRTAIDRVRQTLVACGFFESITFSFVSDKLARDFAPADATTLVRVAHAVRKADGQLRPSILPGLLESLRHNETVGTAGAKLFECGSVFYDTAQGSKELKMVALVAGDDLRAARGAIEALLKKLDPRKTVEFRPTASPARPGLDVSSSGEILWQNQPAGVFGRVAAGVADKLSLRGKPFVAELDLQLLVDGTQHVPQLSPLPKFPAVRRDLSLTLSDAIRFGAVWEMVKGLKLEHLEAVEYVTTYRGNPLEKGTKSLTITLVFRSQAGTLTSEAVDASVAAVVSAAADKLGAALRT